jgi:hypothetical protein
MIVALMTIAGFGNAGCGLFSKSSPTATFTAFYDASKKKDAVGVKKYLSKKSLEIFDAEAKKENKSLDEYLKEAVADPSLSEKMPELRNEKITGDTATVEMKRDKSDQWDTVPFIKEDGEWKLAFDRLVETPSPTPAPTK